MPSPRRPIAHWRAKAAQMNTPDEKNHAKSMYCHQKSRFTFVCGNHVYTISQRHLGAFLSIEYALWEAVLAPWRSKKAPSSNILWNSSSIWASFLTLCQTLLSRTFKCMARAVPKAKMVSTSQLQGCATACMFAPPSSGNFVLARSILLSDPLCYMMIRRRNNKSIYIYIYIYTHMLWCLTFPCHSQHLPTPLY